MSEQFKLSCGDPIDDTSNKRFGPAVPLWISVDCRPMWMFLNLRPPMLGFLPSCAVDKYKKQISFDAFEKLIEHYVFFRHLICHFFRYRTILLLRVISPLLMKN